MVGVPDRTLDPDDLAERLAEVYLVVGPLYRRVLRLVERDGASGGVSVGVRAVLDLLRRHGPMTVPQLGRAQSLSRQFVQRMVNEAAADDLVELVTNPAHRRSRLVSLTGRGREVITGVVRREHAQLREVGGDLTGVEVDACLKVLAQMLTALDDVDADGEP
jgi:DNA-binding MarR family transcriptional regulator